MVEVTDVRCIIYGRMENVCWIFYLRYLLDKFTWEAIQTACHAFILLFLFNTFHDVDIGSIVRYFLLRVPFLIALMGGELEDCKANFESILG